MKSNLEQLTYSLSLSATESQKAWHVFSLLVLIGKPTFLPDLASQCTLFPANPAVISSLCSIPNSPITLSDDKHFVSISSIGLSSFAAYLARNFTVTYAFTSPPIEFGGFPKIWLRKRKRYAVCAKDKEEKELVLSVKRIRNYCMKVHYVLLAKSGARQLSCKEESIENVESKMNLEDYMRRNVSKKLVAKNQSFQLESQITREKPKSLKSIVYTLQSVMIGAIYRWWVENFVDCTTTDFSIADNEVTAEDSKKEEKPDLASKRQVAEDLSPSFNTSPSNIPPERDLKSLDEDNCNHKMPSVGEEHPIVPAGASVMHSIAELSVHKEQLSEPSEKAATNQGYMVAPALQTPNKSLGHTKVVNTYKRKQHCERDHLTAQTAQKSTQNHKEIYVKEKRGNSSSISSQDLVKPKVLPDFESYIVEEEQGETLIAGGYSTVYRARRKNDGALVAIKRPHANAHKNYGNNELKTLEHIGGRNFVVIRYEGCIKSENSNCFVLQYVEHDRPEVLKKEITVCQLQWYAYCLFKALANLHRQGIVHRDVKPGNFLFSRKTNKGYLIDFNLATDMHQKCRSMDKSKFGYNASFYCNTVPAKAIHPTNSSKSLNTFEPKNMRKTTGQRKAHNDLSSWNKINGQCADGLGITSAKDVSARTLSAERLRDPLPCQGRKELITLVQEAMQSPNHRVSHVPTTVRKGVAASPGKIDRQVLHLTPMPLNSTSFAISGVGLTKSKGDGKREREGPCAGTKGFRAPEVLFRSQYQGLKIDIWTAGVTLLYLMIGKSPFFGDPEWNIKDIAKLRGSEDLWEVAKLHNRESTFPGDLYGEQYLTSMNLREWYQMYAKRRDFFQEIPSSFYDLVNKCLTVNPRLRITAEDALKHEFFTSIHENLRKQKILKQGLSLDQQSFAGRKNN